MNRNHHSSNSGIWNRAGRWGLGLLAGGLFAYLAWDNGPHKMETNGLDQPSPAGEIARFAPESPTPANATNTSPMAATVRDRDMANTGVDRAAKTRVVDSNHAYSETAAASHDAEAEAISQPHSRGPPD